MSLDTELRALINCHNAENGSDTPDYILASYLVDCLNAFDRAVNARETWHGRKPRSFMEEKTHLTTGPTRNASHSG